MPDTLLPKIHTKMLRRKPTTIILTPEDIAAYDDTRAARADRLNHLENLQYQSMRSPGKSVDGKLDPNDELKPLPGARTGGTRSGGGSGMDREREREREARIVGR